MKNSREHAICSTSTNVIKNMWTATKVHLPVRHHWIYGTMDGLGLEGVEMDSMYSKVYHGMDSITTQYALVPS